ncbi:MAG: hypothetical protein ABIJ25_13530 [Pseudomonadota bacterium]
MNHGEMVPEDVIEKGAGLFQMRGSSLIRIGKDGVGLARELIEQRRQIIDWFWGRFFRVVPVRIPAGPAGFDQRIDRITSACPSCFVFFETFENLLFTVTPEKAGVQNVLKSLDIMADS